MRIMEIKKNFLLPLISLIFIFGVLGVVSAASDLTLINPVGGNYYKGIINIQWSFVGTPDGPIRIEFDDGSGWTFLGQVPEGSTSKNWNTDGKNGNYEVYVYEKDTGADDVSSIFIIDNIPPTSSAGLLNAYQNSLTFDIPFTVDDANPDSVELFYSIDGGSSWTLDGTFILSPISFTASEDGDYKFYTIATDLAGNEESKDPLIEASTTVDTIEPVTTDLGTDTNWYNLDVTVTLTPTDERSGIANTYYCVDQLNSCNPTTSGTSVTVSTEGENYVRYYSVDNAGNAEEVKTAANTVKIDTTLPTTSLSPDAPGEGELIVSPGDTTITVTCDDGSGGGCSEVGYQLSVSCPTNSEDYIIALESEISFDVSSEANVCTYAKDEAGNKYFSSSPTTYKVFTSIQGAINAAATSGDTINVAAGTYVENVVIGKSLTLQGENRDITIIQSILEGGMYGSYGDRVVIIESSDVTVSGFTFSGYTATEGKSGTTSWPVYADGDYTNIEVSNNAFTFYTQGGIRFLNVINSLIKGNEFKKETRSVWYDPPGVEPGSYVDRIYGGSGPELWGGSNIDIIENIMKEVTGVGLFMYASNVNIHDNIIVGLSGVANDQGILLGGSNIDIRGNTITGFMNGDHPSYNNGLKGAGISVSGSPSDITIEENNIIGNSIGIYASELTSVADIKIHNNNIKGNDDYGVCNFKFPPGLKDPETNENLNYWDYDKFFPADTTVNAEFNWWGDLDPSDQVSANVDYTPWDYDIGLYDESPPTSTINSPGAGSWQNNDFIVSRTNTDTGGSKLATCEVKILNDGEGLLPWTIGDCNTDYIVDISMYCITEGANKCEVQIKSTDNSGNPSATDIRTFSIDWTEPIGSIEINSNDDYTDLIFVTLTLTSDDTFDNDLECRYSNDGSIWEDWETCTTTKSWTLSSGDGEKTVYYEIKDDAENVVQDSDSITLDTLLPEITGLNAFGVEVDSLISVTATVMDPSGINNVVLHYTIQEGSEQTAPMTPPLEDEYTANIDSQSSSTTIDYFVVAQDNAGNTQTSLTFTITVHDLIWDLQSEWNLVSVPKTLVDSSVSVLGSANIWEYDGVSWTNPSTIEPGIGYWVDTNGNEEVGFDYAGDCTGGEGCIPTGDINLDALQPRWNLIGITTPETGKTVEEIFSSPTTGVWIPGLYYIISYNEDTGKFDDDFLTVTDTMNPGEGYWVYLFKLGE